VVGHEAIGVTDPVVPFVDMLKGIQKNFPVMIIFKDRLLLISRGKSHGRRHLRILCGEGVT